jgi:predicted ATPase
MKWSLQEQRINETELVLWYINKTDKLVVKLTKRNRNKTSISKIRLKKGGIENLEEMDKFLDTYDLP